MTALAALAAPGAERTLGEALAAWLPARRWYAGKARILDELHVHDVALLAGSDSEVLLVLADVRYADGGHERYHVPLSIGPDDSERAAIVALLPEGPLVDALADPRASRLLARLCLSGEPHATARGATLRGTPVPRAHDHDAAATSMRPSATTIDQAAVSDQAIVRPMGGQQSNSSVVLGERLVLKVFRKLEAGVNPDVELTRALTAADAGTVPAQHGALELHGREPTTLAVLVELVHDAVEGWQLATQEVQSLAAGDGRASGTGTGAEPVGRQGAAGLLDDAEVLGQAVARTHAALADALGRHRAGPGTRERWAHGMRTQAERVLATAEAHAPVAAAAVLERADELVGAAAVLAAVDDVGPLLRVHGDLHLGQVLRDTHGRWLLLDFEGEPARPLAERREPHTPLKDVAGMLRSFDYAAAQVPPSGLVDNWRSTARRRFLAGWHRVAETAALTPASPTDAERLLALLELDKAVYELGYELANRPDWVIVPVAGILTALDRITRPTGEVPMARPARPAHPARPTGEQP